MAGFMRESVKIFCWRITWKKWFRKQSVEKESWRNEKKISCENFLVVGKIIPKNSYQTQISIRSLGVGEISWRNSSKEVYWY